MPLSPWGRAHERVFALVVRGKPRSGVEEKNPLARLAALSLLRSYGGLGTLSREGRGIFFGAV
jgi:hypothetical protein